MHNVEGEDGLKPRALKCLKADSPHADVAKQQGMATCRRVAGALLFGTLHIVEGLINKLFYLISYRV